MGKDKSANKRETLIVFGAALGAAFGAATGTIFESVSISIGISLGIGLGAAAAIIFGNKIVQSFGNPDTDK